ncbi:LOW QUALITY PROTEIN: sodium/glucose cotransporter 2 [Hippoglossus stenolepis]|uniref:LOW QUALITY PROTEIN: sodium/glucose cotransporter 2 n=1 Tax=Hippoglossus stenolepis TaxID=195615 RepID=UPI00159CBFE9|nr:LOW QUALITY PROTEIN: sodium/glucose cotransporter 2 [Hippoglossus stenolepis]
MENHSSDKVTINNPADISIIIGYFIMVVSVGIWSMFWTNRGTVGGYFLAGRSMSWWPVSSTCAFAEVGGYSSLLAKYSSAMPSNFSSMDPQCYNISSLCYTPRQDAFNLLRDPTKGDLPWPGVLFGIAIVGGWYWCTDQVNIQVQSCHFTCFEFKPQTSSFLFLSEVGCSNIAYPKLVVSVMPNGTGSCIFPSNCPFLVCGIHYLHFAIILFFCTFALVLLVSYCTEPIEDQHLHRLVFSLRHSKEERKDLDWEQEEKGRRARREAEDRMRENINSGAGTEEEEGSGICRLIARLCGRASSSPDLQQEAPEETEQMPDISEEPVWKVCTVDANAFIMMALAVFMWGYFA